jgi:MFS family permease
VSALVRRVPAWAITASFALAYVLVAPASSDLAAAGYRSDLFARAGFTLWDNGWYGGHHLLAYSLLAPALGALLGPQLLAALSMTAATALFALLIDGEFPPRATRIASLWFAYGAAIGLLANRVAFDLGLAIGLGALLAARASTQIPRPSSTARLHALTVALAILCALASPIAGAFLALGAVAWGLAGTHPDRRFAFALAFTALLPIVVLVLSFPEGGPQPFVASAFYPTLAAVLLIAVLMPPKERALRVGALLYAVALVGMYMIPTAVGGNVDRLGALMAGPLVAACVFTGRSSGGFSLGFGRHGNWRAGLLVVAAPLLIYWQSNAPVGDFASAASDPGVKSGYYTPLIDELRRLGVGYEPRPARIEVVPTRDHGEARFLAPHVMIARGWERQLDVNRNALFYERPLRPDHYEDWLSFAAISYVALPDAPLDYSARAEARLVRARPSYLREVWRSRHWRLFAVLGAVPLAEPPSVLTAIDSDSFSLRTPSAGTFRVRVRFTPYWALAGGHGCVRSAAGGWTDVQTPRAGSVRVVIDFSLARVFEHGPRCR